jgi:RNA polymerase sigma-70 factor, ECF subfamily
MYLASKRLPGMATAGRSTTEVALEEFESVYGFIYSRVGNRADAEDLTQQVALKALPRLREGEPAPAVRGYLYATARSVLATMWSSRLRLPESELPENLHLEAQGHEVLPSAATAAVLAGILDGLSRDHRQVLELRFLRGYSLRETADEMGKTLGSVKVMQLRALRSAAAVGNALGFDF